ncbi:peroxidase 10 isoform X1 [Syzygium oleosum]|uniref:peroxidase 10 isoform X1 n=2 Tax=Syzygium oleosum TaxID=219896 RepID=UPI0011D23B88|nr:peroxidase 10 isoform X1 [Syzygium oleosum]
MASKHFWLFQITLISLNLVVSSFPDYSRMGQLSPYYYDRSCPRLEMIVRYNVLVAFKKDTRIAASLLRLHFHDCIVDGCEGSVLLDDTIDMKGEKNALPNRNSLRGFDVIDNIKTDLEKFCPCTVSCTDILTLAAREAVYMSGGPYWAVPLGRKDGITASDKSANEQIPSPIEPLDNIIAKFTSKGLEVKDVAVLSGGHTIGFAQCFTFKRRLFDFKGSGKPDPNLDTSLLSSLQSVCPNSDASNTNLAPLDSTVDTFDNYYYANLVNNSGLLESDQALIGDARTASLVNYYTTNPTLFFNDFAASMVKLGNVGILTGQSGQIRKKCGSVN